KECRSVCQPVFPMQASTAVGLGSRRRMLSCQRGIPTGLANTQSDGFRCNLRHHCSAKASANRGSMGSGSCEAPAFVSPTRPLTTLRFTSRVRSSQFKSPHCKPMISLARTGVFRSVRELEGAIREYIEVHNEDPKPFVWTKTADQILASIARYVQRTTASNL